MKLLCHTEAGCPNALCCHYSIHWDEASYERLLHDPAGLAKLKSKQARIVYLADGCPEARYVLIPRSLLRFGQTSHRMRIAQLERFKRAVEVYYRSRGRDIPDCVFLTGAKRCQLYGTDERTKLMPQECRDYGAMVPCREMIELGLVPLSEITEVLKA